MCFLLTVGVVNTDVAYVDCVVISLVCVTLLLALFVMRFQVVIVGLSICMPIQVDCVRGCCLLDCLLDYLFDCLLVCLIACFDSSLPQS